MSLEAENGVGDKVLVRLKSKRKAPNRRHVVEGKIIKKSKHSDNYKVKFNHPVSKTVSEMWISVEDITSVQAISSSKEPPAEKTRKQKERRSDHRKSKYFLPYTKNDRYEIFENQGFELAYDPPGDGNCQFSAISYLLSLQGIFASPAEVRKAAVDYLTVNENSEDGVPLKLFAGEPWEDYLIRMVRDRTHGDQLTLQAVSNIYNVQINLVSSLGEDARVLIQPNSSDNDRRIEPITLGHFAEGHGEHFVALFESTDSGDNTDFHCDSNVICQNKQDNKNLGVTPWDSLPDEIWVMIIKYSLMTPGPSVSEHVSSTYASIRAVNSRFKQIAEMFQNLLPRIYISNVDLIHRKNDQQFVSSVFNIIKKFG